MREIIMAYQGEMALKGLNKSTFEAVLMKSSQIPRSPYALP